jgi:hypothetical protein
MFWWIPLLVVVIAAGFYSIFDFVMQKQGAYIRKLEEYFAGSTDPEGWERFLNQGHNKIFIGVIRSPFWLFMFVATAVIAAIQTFPPLRFF